MVNVVLDSDFLSSFLKIEALHRIRDYFRTDTLLVPTAVFREVALTSLLPQLAGTAWLEVREEAPTPLVVPSPGRAPGRLRYDRTS